MKRLLELLQFTYDKLKDKKEIAIIEEYGNTGKRYTILLTCKRTHSFKFIPTLAVPNKTTTAFLNHPLVTGVCSTFLFTIFSFWPSVLEIVSPTNESQLHAQLITTEYFIDPEKYLFLILLHAVAAIWIGGISLVAIGSTTVAFSYFQCGIFKVARWDNLQFTRYNKNSNSVQFVYSQVHKFISELVCLAD